MEGTRNAWETRGREMSWKEAKSKRLFRGYTMTVAEPLALVESARAEREIDSQTGRFKILSVASSPARQ
ncbi:MAG: hypothetical protein BGO12_07265 [Verrucomicrobia bacterium 61-8]|nr:MAG: hypothetical protein BGO12_07265 [Verrucomicrobia bacterium 61-8]